MPELVGPKTSSERVQTLTQHLQALIEGSATDSNARLPSERQLAARFQCSRNTVREALAALAARGLIGIRGRSGAYRQPVAGVPTTPVDLDQALAALDVTVPSLASLAAATAAMAGVSRLETLTSNLSQALLNRDSVAVYRWYVTFFVELAGIVGNVYLVGMLKQIKEASQQLPTGRLIRREQSETFFSGVVELLQALRRGDGRDAAAIAARGLKAFAIIMRAAKPPRQPVATEHTA